LLEFEKCSKQRKRKSRKGKDIKNEKRNENRKKQEKRTEEKNRNEMAHGPLAPACMRGLIRPAKGMYNGVESAVCKTSHV
jgi:hypothetical protein